MPPGEESLWDGRYVLVRTLGEGGMGRVVMAHDRLQGDRLLALKRLLPAFADEAAAFLREFQIHRQLAHPNVPRAYELGHALDDGVLCPYFTMEISDGVPLLDLVVRSGRALSMRAVFQIAAGLLRALDHVHRRGFVHGDLKPANVLVAERFAGLHVHLIDFGVALPLGTATPEEVLATPEYAAPEQLFGESVDQRTDLYALGLLLYELIEHRRPWLESEPEVLALARVEGPVPALTATGCPPSLAALVRRLLAAELDDRPSTAAEVLAELDAATGWDAELETPDAFVQHLLTVPLPWRRQVQEVAREILSDDARGSWVTVIDVPPGYFARRLLGPVLDVAALAGARVLPLRFDARFGDEPPELGSLLPTAADARRTVIVIENVDHADEGTITRILEARRSDTRLVATRLDAGRPFHESLAKDARIIALEPWDEAAIRGWIAQALGPIALPLDGLPSTPAALVEALGALAREGRITRTRTGYTLAEPGTGAQAIETPFRPEGIEALLACIGAPIPEAALAIYLGGEAHVVPDLLARGALRARGDGTVEVAETLAGAASAQLSPARRAGLHRRLAQALEESGAAPRRIADAWLASDAPLLAVPHLLAAAELRPGRSWLEHSLALVGRARQILATAAHEAEAPDLELWRYAALVMRSEARIRLACGEPVDALVEALAALGTDMGHRHTLQSAIELRIEVARRRQDWDRVVEDTLALVALEAGGHIETRGAEPRTTPPRGTDRVDPDAQARIHLARGQRFVGQGLPTAALVELDAGLAAAERAPVERRLQLLAARAELCLEVQWADLVEAATQAYLDVALRAGRAEHRARARLFQAARLRVVGRIDRALAAIRETVESLPRQRAPRLDGEIELELGWCHLELGDFGAAREHARYAASLAEEDGDPALVTHALALEATACWYLGEHARAWAVAQRADRALVLELALAERGYAGADAVLREASQAGYAYQRRLERTRAARAFRIAAEAALVRGEHRMAKDLADRSLACLRAEGEQHLHLPRHIATVARAARALGEEARADEIMAQARAEVMALAVAIADVDIRAAWLAHPEQQRILDSAPRDAPRTGRRGRKRVRTGSRRQR